MLGIPQIGEFYRHYKGAVYRIIPVPKREEDGATFGSQVTVYDIDIWYQDIKTNQVWTRKIFSFMEEVEIDSKLVKRFELIENGANLISDGYHTFGELYEHRNILFLSFLDNCDLNRIKAWRSQKHHDGSSYDGWFIIGCNLNDQQISYHLPMELWKCCDWLKTYDVAPVPWDGHTSQDVLNRLKGFLVTSNF